MIGRHLPPPLLKALEIGVFGHTGVSRVGSQRGRKFVFQHGSWRAIPISLPNIPESR